MPGEVGLDIEDLYQRYRIRIFRAVAGVVFDDAAAEDLTQETFERAWRARRSFRGSQDEAGAWLYRIAMNAAVSWLRRQRLARLLPTRLFAGGDPAAESLEGVVVDTANRLQGLTFEVVVAWHPLAGATVTDAFHLDPGRQCVLLTRHRQACVVVGRDTDRSLLEGVPPATPGYLGWDPDPVLDGWDVHENVFALLEPHRVDV